MLGGKAAESELEDAIAGKMPLLDMHDYYLWILCVIWYTPFGLRCRLYGTPVHATCYEKTSKLLVLKASCNGIAYQ